MARSFIDPSLVALATEPAAPPWNWNPGATFQTAFNDAQTNQRAQEKAAMDRELNAILFPAKKAQAEFTIKQLAYETELLSDTFKTRTAELDGRRRLLREGRIGGSGSGTSEAVGNPDGGRYGGQVADILKSYQSGTAVPPSGGGGKILGTGLNP